LLPSGKGLALLLAGMLAQFMADYVLAHKAPGLYPAWLLNLRGLWTAGVCLALILASALLS
ncbi:MAG: hypothetical protein JO142_01865, partial [Burkholderiales bacterium]|nr:hypothetical protein [Burkholderiales bacterium]